jgi:flagellar motility protein MotE (MotC chaperone)
MKKALDYLYAMKNANEQMGQEPINIKEAIKELEDLQSRSCENCYESKTCKILHSVYKDRLKKEGYAMHKNEFKCGFWHSLF